MNQQIIEQLQTLKLKGVLIALREQQESKQYLDLSFEERLAFLLERECSRRKNNQLQLRLRQAKLKHSACIEQIDFVTARGLQKKQLLELAELAWLEHRKNIFILGPTGVGKTYLACALADQACKQGFSALYSKTVDLLAQRIAAKADGSFKTFAANLAKINLLILDEWLREPLADDYARELLDLLDDRYKNSSCILASQTPVENWYAMILNPTLAEAILDRIIHNSLRLELVGESMRKALPLQSNVASLR